MIWSISTDHSLSPTSPSLVAPVNLDPILPRRSNEQERNGHTYLVQPAGLLLRRLRLSTAHKVLHGLESGGAI
jgi:hypothetical protein